jgi:plastocyanin
MKKLRTTLALGVITTTALILVGCGGDDDDNGAASATSASSPSRASTTSPADEATPAGDSGVVEVAASEFAFTPDSFEAQSGEPITVKVEATGNTIHTLTVYEDEERTTPIPGADVTVSPELDGEFTVTFEEPGTLYFFCGVHPDQMQGEITVQ